MSDTDVLLPFHHSRQVRHAYLDRTRLILSTTVSNGSAQLLTLPNNLDFDGPPKNNERRPTSTYVLRPPSSTELAVLLDPRRCNCHFVNDSTTTKIILMYRVAGNGEGQAMMHRDVSPQLVSQVYNNRFSGCVILGILLDGPDNVTSSTDISSLGGIIGVSDNGLLHNCILEPGCSVHKNTEISSTHVMKYAAIIGCGSVTCSDTDVQSAKKVCNFNMHDGSMDIELGPEAGGGRIANVRVECTMVDVCHTLNMDPHDGGTADTLLTTMSIRNNDDVGSSPPMNVLCPHSSILHTPRVKHVHLLSRASIDSATSVVSALLLSNSTIKHGCTVTHALLQWDATITSQSDAKRICLMEHAEVGPHSFTANSIFGPDSHISGGEVHGTLFGPNANSHHQSLLIGILWPLGRGNVGYGSNVGSNHTGRIPDQETSVGEGTFWGLGCVIKFPVDMTFAPYSIVAAGVQLPPQRIMFPFSLVTDGPGGMNQLTPGWLLHYSPYTIARSEVKFANRRMAKRHDFYTGWKILRASVMDMMSDARNRLVVVGQSTAQSAGEGGASTKKKVVYKTDKAVIGLGANQLTEQGRLIGIKAYTSALQRYALRGLLDRLVTYVKEKSKSAKLSSSNEALRHVGLEGVNLRSSSADIIPSPSNPIVNWPVLPWNEKSHVNVDALWSHQHKVLLYELPSIIAIDNNTTSNILSVLLRKCIELEDDHAKRVYDSKSRDDVRGADTIPGYADVHIAAEKDSVVLMAKKDAEDVRRDVQLVEDALGVVIRSRL